MERSLKSLSPPYVTCTVNLPLRPPWGGGGCLFTSNTWEGGGRGGLNRDGDLFNLAKTMVLILHKELEYKMAKAQVQEVGDHAAEDQKQIGTSS